MANFRLFVPAQAVGASLVYFDLWNPSVSRYTVQSVIPFVSGAVAVSGLLGVDLFLTRTTAIGTGGTAATYEGTSVTAMTISHQDGLQGLNSAIISARLTPSGGATGGAVISGRTLFSEETNAGTYTPQVDFVQSYTGSTPLSLPGGTGIRIIQGGVASVGNIGFDVTFSI